MNNSYILLRHAHSKFSSDDFNRTLSEKGFSSLDQLEFLNFLILIIIFLVLINEHLKRLIARQFNLIK